MNEKYIGIETEEGFYRAVAETLWCADHSYKPFPYSKRTRWNNRESGNGRFPGHGIVRRYSANTITIALYNPKLNGKYITAEAALDAIAKRLL